MAGQSLARIRMPLLAFAFLLSAATPAPAQEAPPVIPATEPPAAMVPPAGGESVPELHGPADRVMPSAEVADPTRLPQQPGAAAGASPDAGASAEPGPDGGGTAESAPGGALAVAPASAPEATDLVSIVLQAHPVVQATMALLAAMVVVVVTIFLFKVTELALSGRRLLEGFAQLARAESLALVAPAATASGKPGRRAAAPEPIPALMHAIADELATLPQAIGAIEADGLHERLALAFERIEGAAIARLRAGTGALPQIASTAPFIGLFGTVFGIMNAFLAIAESNTTSLAVVAPGIAEALLATAIGLVAAIPAVIVHNLLQRRIGAFRRRLGDATALAGRLVSRELTGRRLAGRELGLG